MICWTEDVASRIDTTGKARDEAEPRRESASQIRNNPESPFAGEIATQPEQTDGKPRPVRKMVKCMMSFAGNVNPV